MPRNRNAVGVSLDALETLLDEVLTEGAEPYLKRLEKLDRLKPGSEAYNDLLGADVHVALDVIRIKAEEAMKAIDEWMESLPDEE